jgi:uncharacterized protein YqkB
MKVLICDVNNLNEKTYHETDFPGDEDNLIDLWEKNIFPFEYANLKQIFIDDNMKDIVELFSNYEVLVFKSVGNLCVRKYNTIFKIGTTKKITLEVISIDLRPSNN